MRRTLPRMTLRRLLAVLAAIVALFGVVLVGTASAHTGGGRNGVTARTNPVPTLNQGESATFRVVDTGRAIIITGTARGMTPGTYLSLIYTNPTCSANALGNTGLTVDGAWQSHGQGRQTLFAAYTGADYQAVRGKILSVSIREVVSVDLTNNAAAPAVLQPRACAPLPRAV